MSTNDPEQIRQDIERTRAELSDDVNALGDKVSPRHIAGRQAGRARDAASNLKDRVMGSAHDDSMTSSATDAMSSGADAVRSAPTTVRRQAQGNPLAAGLIAFGAGWLLSSLLPASRPEQQAAAQLRDKAGDMSQPVMEQAKQAGQEMVDNLRQPAQDAVGQVRSTAQDAADHVSGQAQQATQDVKQTAAEQRTQ